MNIPSAARKLASQTNGRLSRGPLTPQSKARSRAGSYKHGMTGAGVVLPDEDVVEVSKRFDDLQAQFNPATPMGKILIRRVAFLSLRLDRSAEQEAATSARRSATPSTTSTRSVWPGSPSTSPTSTPTPPWPSVAS